MLTACSELEILIIGHSHVYWLGEFVDSTGSPGLFANFERQGHRCNISFLGFRGATITTFRKQHVMARISNFRYCNRFAGGQ